MTFTTQANPVLNALSTLESKQLGPELIAAMQAKKNPRPVEIGSVQLAYHLDDGSLPLYEIHPQGMALDLKRNLLIIQAVEIKQKRAPVGESAGRGQGYLFMFDRRTLQSVKTLPLHKPDDAYYHPGGIVIEGDDLYVPLAEYRPSGHSRILKINLESKSVDTMFEVPDHIGNLAKFGEIFWLFSWGSQTWYEYSVEGKKISSKLSPVDDALGHQDAQLVSTTHVILSGIQNKRSGVDVIRKDGAIELSWRWDNIQTAQGKQFLENPSLFFRNSVDEVFVLVAPDSQYGKYKPQPAQSFEQPDKLEERRGGGTLTMFIFLNKSGT